MITKALMDRPAKALGGSPTRTISITVAGSGEVRDVTLGPGATVKQVLEKAGLSGYQISTGPDQPFLDLAKDLHQSVPEGGKLYATSPAEAGMTRGGPESASAPFPRT